MTTSTGPRRRELIRPPTLRTGEQATASRLELFFDLAYVLVVIELADTFYADLTWRGAATFAAVFVALWLSWVGFALYANRFDTDDVVFRLAKLAATLGIAGCAAAASGATTSFSTPFVLSFLVARVVLLLLHLRAWRHVEEARPTIAVYLAANAAVVALWAASLAVGGSARWVLWAVAVAVDVAGPILATARGDRTPLHVEHLPERFGLFVILVLGEAVGGVVTGVHDAKWMGLSVAVAVVGFVLTAALWWNYFDITATHSEDELKAEDERDDEERGAAADERHDLFVYGHLPMSLGVVMAGVGLEDLVLHPDEAQPSTGAWVLVAGLLLYLLGSALILGGIRRTWRAVWPWPTAALPLVLLAALPGHQSALLLVGVLTAIAVALAVVGTLQPGTVSPRDEEPDERRDEAGRV
jgi:low temperature requirement protein LtrA